MQVPTLYRDPLLTKQQLPLFSHKRGQDRRGRSVNTDMDLPSEFVSRPGSRDRVSSAATHTRSRWASDYEDIDTEVHLQEEGVTIKRSRYPNVELNQQLNDCFNLIKAYDKIERIYEKRGKPIIKPLQSPKLSVKSPHSKPEDLAQVKRMKERCHVCDKLTCVCIISNKDEYLDRMNQLFLRSHKRSRVTEEKLKARTVRGAIVSPVRPTPKKQLELKLPSKDSDLVLFIPSAEKKTINSTESLTSVPTLMSPIYQPFKPTRVLLPEIALQQTLLNLAKERSINRSKGYGDGFLIRRDDRRREELRTQHDGGLLEAMGNSNLTSKGSRVLKAKQPIFRNVSEEVEQLSVSMDDIVMITAIGRPRNKPEV